MKLAHLILAHNNPSQLERLVQRISHPDADVYIHIDTKADMMQFEPVKNISGVSIVKNSVSVVWGEYSIIQATLNGMEEILASGIQYSHINLLSGNDYQLKDTDYIHNFLFANAGKSFMWYDRIFDDWIHGQVRMNNYYLGEYGFPGRYKLGALMSKLLPARKMPEKLVPYGRSQWMTITPESAAYVLKYLHDHNNVRRHFINTWAVDEVLFQTILCNSPLRDTLINDNLRYIPLTPGFRPVLFTIAEKNDLISSGKFYARKFDANVDTAIFDFLDSQSGYKL